MPSGKYPVFNKSKNKNPFVKNTKSISSISKKNSVMVNENNTGILSPTITIENYYYDLGYYNIENNSTYYEDSVTSTTNIFFN